MYRFRKIAMRCTVLCGCRESEETSENEDPEAEIPNGLIYTDSDTE